MSPDTHIPEPNDTESWSADLRAVEGSGRVQDAAAHGNRTAEGPSLIVPEPVLQTLVEPDPWPQDDRLSLLLGMADGADESCYREGHSRRVAGLVRLLVAEEHLPEGEADALVIAARLHDIGKMGMPLKVIEAVSDDAEAREQLRAHAGRGADFVTGLRLTEAARDAIRYHHEHWDGSGYPEGRSGEEIPLGARIIGLAEAIDAASAPARAGGVALGRSPWPVARLLAAAHSEAGRKWDPELVARLTRLLIPALAGASQCGNARWVSADLQTAQRPEAQSRLA